MEPLFQSMILLACTVLVLLGVGPSCVSAENGEASCCAREQIIDGDLIVQCYAVVSFGAR